MFLPAELLVSMWEILSTKLLWYASNSAAVSPIGRKTGRPRPSLKKVLCNFRSEQFVIHYSKGTFIYINAVKSIY